MGKCEAGHRHPRVGPLVLTGVAVASSWRGSSCNGSRATAGAFLTRWIGGGDALFLGGGILVAGWQVRKFRDGVSGATMTPLRSRPPLVLGRTAALTGAALTGWYSALLLVLLPDADIESQPADVAVRTPRPGRRRTRHRVLLQRWCRIHPRDEGDEDELGQLNGHAEDR